MNTEEQTKPAEVTLTEPATPPPPATLHELLAMAIKDFREVLSDPHYRVCMNLWYDERKEEGICYVCLAGAFVSQRMKPVGDQICWETVPPEWQRALEALNFVRAGYVTQALGEYYCNKNSPGKGHDPASIRALGKRIGTVYGHPLARTSPRFDSTNPEPFLRYLDSVHAHLEAITL